MLDGKQILYDITIFRSDLALVCFSYNYNYELLSFILQLESLLPFKKHTDNILAFHGKDEVLSAELWQEIESILTVLQPVKVCTLKLQCEQITSSDFFLLWKNLQLKLSLEEHNLAKLILANMKKRTNHLFINRAYLGGIFLDPRCNVLLEDEDRRNAKNFLIDLHKIVEKQLPLGATLKNEDSDRTESFSELSDQSLIEVFLQSHDKKKTDIIENRKNGIENLLDDFESHPRIPHQDSVLQFWQRKVGGRFDKLVALANVVYSVPPTQVSVERTFSTLRFVLDDLRTRLTDEHLSDILLLKANYNFGSKSKLFEFKDVEEDEEE